MNETVRKCLFKPYLVLFTSKCIKINLRENYSTPWSVTYYMNGPYCVSYFFSLKLNLNQIDLQNNTLISYWELSKWNKTLKKRTKKFKNFYIHIICIILLQIIDYFADGWNKQEYGCNYNDENMKHFKIKISLIDS